MKIDYDDAEDTLRIELQGGRIVRDESHGWNVNIGYTETGIGQIVILDAKAAGFWPIENAAEILRKAA
jgi:uncharacterized protein YuzE